MSTSPHLKGLVCIAVHYALLWRSRRPYGTRCSCARASESVLRSQGSGNLLEPMSHPTGGRIREYEYPSFPTLRRIASSVTDTAYAQRSTQMRSQNNLRMTVPEVSALNGRRRRAAGIDGGSSSWTIGEFLNVQGWTCSPSVLGGRAT